MAIVKTKYDSTLIYSTEQKQSGCIEKYLHKYKIHLHFLQSSDENLPPH